MVLNFNMTGLSFDIITRFYTTCFYNQDFTFENVKTEIIDRVEKVGFLVEEVTLHKLEDFNYQHYEELGFIQIELKPLTSTPEPSDVFKVSQEIESLCTKFNGTKSDELFLDIRNPPYIVNIATKVSDITLGSSDENIWTKDNIYKYKKDLGKWIEFYSGQFSDYSEELYLSRIENNLSNRLSEVHFIRTNSSFIFMPIDSFNQFMPYMNRFFIEQILRVRSLLFCYFILNKEIDVTNDRFPELKQSLPAIEEEIERVEDLGRLIQKLASRVFTERIVNRRSHSKKVLNTCYDIFQIEITSSTLDEKIENLRESLSSVREKHRQDMAKQQKRWMSILTLLFGSQVVFTLKDQLLAILNITKDTNELFYEIINAGLWLIIGIVVTIAVGGLTYTWLKGKIDLRKLNKKGS